MNNVKEGVYFINKPIGWTSFDVVAKIRAGIKQKTGKRIKVGHCGTLDPFAEGLLIILIGAATKKQAYYLKKDKEYVATLVLGQESETGDSEGTIVRFSESESISEKEVRTALTNFIGVIDQMPPHYSAIKVGGERAYKKARRGETFSIPAREVTIKEIECLEYHYPVLKFRVFCSSGTYVRVLGADIAKALGTKGYLSTLKRTKIGSITVAEAIQTEEVLEQISS